MIPEYALGGIGTSRFKGFIKFRNRDCPSKFRTVGRYVHALLLQSVTDGIK